MKKARDVILTIVTVGSLAAFGLLFLLLPKGPDLSEEANRMLASAPAFSDLLEDGFNEDLAAYIADRFPLRTAFVRAKAYTELLTGKAENNGVIFADGGYLISRSDTGDGAKAKAAGKVSDVLAYSENSSSPVLFFLTGSPAEVESFRLPALYDGSGDTSLRLAVADAISKNAELYDLTPALKKAAADGEYVYYKTDHHWTLRGAGYAYRAIVGALGGEEHGFDVSVASEDFYGTTYSSAGLISFGADEVAFASFDGIDDIAVRAYSRSADGYTESEIGLYDLDALSAKDKYKAYLYGNFAMVTVRGGERQKLLVIKDSYFNCVAPMLAANFDMDIIDPRYMRSEDIAAACASGGYAAIIYLYGMQSFV